ncbi:MAG: hypothetical protein Q8L41_06590 [Anaerolineales bacterium]|nr:hypothetical protein [Anaerolineales bacterium]MDP2777351.1 hypothetical protein [Anaerolineales bacterium]
MPVERRPDFSLFLDILQLLERINAPYMVIGAFAATVYGISRVTYDIDIIVELSEEHINALSESYPLPRYYADPVMIRDSIEMGIMFNIIDTERGEKADLVPLSGSLDYRPAFERRVRQLVEIPGAEPFEIWCARPEDVIHGKLLAWKEGRSRKHETDIFEMMIFHFLNEPEDSPLEEKIDHIAKTLGEETNQFWQKIKSDAKKDSNKE